MLNESRSLIISWAFFFAAATMTFTSVLSIVRTGLCERLSEQRAHQATRRRKVRISEDNPARHLVRYIDRKKMFFLSGRDRGA